jgi:hypothetical protein
MFTEELTRPHEWTNFLKFTPESTFYHTLEWKNVLENSFNFKASYFLVKNDNGETVGVFPTMVERSQGLKILNSLPFSDFGGFVFQKSCAPEASLCLMESIRRFCFEEQISLTRMCLLSDASNKFFKPLNSFSDNHRGIMNLDLATRLYLGKNIGSFTEEKN